MQVEQIDREAAVEYWNGLADEWNSWTEISGQEQDATVQAFARHRQQARAEQAAELAKFKALAETLAGALGEIAQPDFSYTGILEKGCWRERTAREALTSYKEARDAS